MNKKITAAILIILFVLTTILTFNSLKLVDQDIFATDFSDDEEDDF